MAVVEVLLGSVSTAFFSFGGKRVERNSLVKDTQRNAHWVHPYDHDPFGAEREFHEFSLIYFTSMYSFWNGP